MKISPYFQILNFFLLLINSIFFEYLGTLGYSIMTFEFAPQKQERKGGWEPIFASNFTLNFRVLIRPYWPGQVHSIIKDIELKLCYQNQNVRGRQGLKKWQSLILFTVRNSYERRHATFIYPWVLSFFFAFCSLCPKI